MKFGRIVIQVKSHRLTESVMAGIGRHDVRLPLATAQYAAASAGCPLARWRRAGVASLARCVR